MTLVEILLPLRDNAGEPQPAEAFTDLSRLLVDRFGGLTAFNRQPAEGSWVSPREKIQHEEVVVLEVMTDYVDRTWWSALRQRLEARFGQEHIVIRASSIEML